jgi:hypothetical protein
LNGHRLSFALPSLPVDNLALAERVGLDRLKMPSGYEQEPDFGGPEPSWQSIALVAAILAGIAITLLYLALEW